MVRIGLLFVVAGMGGQDPVVQVADALAAYRQNALSFRTFRLRWLWQVRLTDEAVAHYRDEAAYFRTRLQQTDSRDTKQRERIARRLRWLEDYEGITARQTTKWYVQELWTDRERFQLRRPLLSNGPGELRAVEAPQIAFPETVPSGKALLDEYADFEILWYRPEDRDRPFWCWLGTRTEGESFMVVRDSQSLDKTDQLNAWPPLVLPPPEWGGRIHPLDDFFTGSPDDRYELLGRWQVDGRTTWVVEWVRPAPARWPPGTKVCLRAYLDLERGGIPLRLFRTLRGTSDRSRRRDRDLSFPDTPLDAVVDVHIERLGEGFYPVKGTICHYIFASEDRGGRRTGIRRIPERMESWEVLQADPNVDLDADALIVQLPPGTRVLDRPTNQHYVVGTAEGLLRPYVRGATQVLRREAGSRIRLLVGVAAGSLLVMSVICVWWFRHQRREQE